jgi:hypothetical protein
MSHEYILYLTKKIEVYYFDSRPWQRLAPQAPKNLCQGVYCIVRFPMAVEGEGMEKNRGLGI